MKILFSLSPRLTSVLILIGSIYGGGAQAAIRVGESDPVLGTGIGSELLLVIWDPVAEVSYTKDLGMNLFAYNSGDKYTDNFFVYAQQDTGYQKFYSPLNKNTDANFKRFSEASTDSANQLWGIYATYWYDDPYMSGTRQVFTTLSSEWSGGGENPEYGKTKNDVNNQELDSTSVQLAAWIKTYLNAGVNSDGSGNDPFNTHFQSDKIKPEDYDYSVNGSSFNVKGGNPYFPKSLGLENGFLANGKGGFTMNHVGSSSWFYYLTVSSDDLGASPLIDEFDNLEHDAYWGLAKADNGDYIVSFTLESALAKATSAIGQQRRNLTDFTALYGNARVLSAPVNEFVGWVPGGSVVNAVPEPATYGLFALGLLMLGLRAKRQA